jgi:Flp pilus assembly protein TadG
MLIFKPSHKQSRKSRGNMMLLSVLGFGLLLIFITLGTSFSMVLFVQNQVQRLADQIALTGACQLNDGNRLGQMNNLIGRCRQLVYVSRQNNYQAAGSRQQDLQQLSQQFLDEDRQNAVALEQERGRLQALAVREATQAMKDSFAQQSALYTMVLPWLVVKPPTMNKVSFGQIAAIDSNVAAQTGIADLADFDKSKRYVQRASQLYVSNIDAKLPEEDADLHFYLSSLPAPVGDNIAPARSALTSVYRPNVGNYLPSATSVAVQIGLATDFVRGTATDFSVASVAASNGASPVR